MNLLDSRTPRPNVPDSSTNLSGAAGTSTKAKLEKFFRYINFGSWEVTDDDEDEERIYRDMQIARTRAEQFLHNFQEDEMADYRGTP